MATSGCSPVAFINLCGNNFYFRDLSEDSFRMSTHSFNYYIQSKDYKFLLCQSKEFKVQTLNQCQQNQPDCKFNIQTYLDIPGGRAGTPAMLYVKVNGNNMVVCCAEDRIYPEAMTLPTRITENHHKAVFYMVKDTAPDIYTFQSSTYPSKFLAFESAENDLKKLVLASKEESDENCQVRLLRYTA